MNELELLIFPAFVVIVGFAALGWMHLHTKSDDDDDSSPKNAPDRPAL